MLLKLPTLDGQSILLYSKYDLILVKDKHSVGLWTMFLLKSFKETTMTKELIYGV